MGMEYLEQEEDGEMGDGEFLCNSLKYGMVLPSWVLPFMFDSDVFYQISAEGSH